MERKHFENIILFLLTFVVAALAGGQSTSDLPVHSTKMVLFGKPRRLALVVVVLKQLSWNCGMLCFSYCCSPLWYFALCCVSFRVCGVLEWKWNWISISPDCCGSAHINTERRLLCAALLLLDARAGGVLRFIVYGRMPLDAGKWCRFVRVNRHRWQATTRDVVVEYVSGRSSLFGFRQTKEWCWRVTIMNVQRAVHMVGMCKMDYLNLFS